MELFFRFVVLAFVGHVCFAAPTTYKVGVGIADVTGPAADINMVYIYIYISFVSQIVSIVGRHDACVKFIQSHCHVSIRASVKFAIMFSL